MEWLLDDLDSRLLVVSSNGRREHVVLMLKDMNVDVRRAQEILLRNVVTWDDLCNGRYRGRNRGSRERTDVWFDQLDQMLLGEGWFGEITATVDA